MPTTRPRYMVTETDKLRDALDRAALQWPALRDDRSALLRRILDQAISGVVERDDERRQRRLAAIRETSGIFSGMYPAGEAQRLREEWPE